MKKLLLFLTLLIGAYYLGCRLSDLFARPTPIGYFYFSLEFFIGICSVLYWRTLYMGHSLDTRLPELAEIDQGTVDILIPTFNEIQTVLVETIDAALLVQGRGEVYVLDDGKREWLKNLCLQKGANYIIRDNDLHAKAGNLNHALSFIKAQYALILDADMRSHPNILLTALPHFEDPTVAIVQFPQEFSNTDSFQHWVKGKNWHDLSFGLITVNPCRNVTKAAYWTGSPSIIRISAFKLIGGVQTGSVTEDLLTTVSLMAKGFWIKSLKEIRAVGLAPKDYEAFCIQRQRWAKGFFQMWLARTNPLRLNISFDAKLECLSDFLYQIQMSFYILSIQILPVVALYFHEEAQIQTQGLFFLWMMSFILMNLSNHVLGGRLFRMVPFQTYMRLAMFPNIWGFFESLPYITDDFFEVTPKGRALKFKTRTIIYILLLVILFLISGISSYISLSKFVHNITDYNLLFIMGWNVLNFSFLGMGLLQIFSPKMLSIKSAAR